MKQFTESLRDGVIGESLRRAFEELIDFLVDHVRHRECFKSIGYDKHLHWCLLVHTLQRSKFFPLPVIVWNPSNNFTFAVQNPKRKCSFFEVPVTASVCFSGAWFMTILSFHVLAVLICALSLTATITAIDLFLSWQSPQLHPRPPFCWWNDFSLDVQNYPLCCPTEYFNLR